MKKLFVSALAMLAVALGFTACSSDEEIAQTPAKQVTVYASTEEPSAQRTALGTQGEDGTYPVLWEATDKIKIGGNVFTLTSGAGFSTGEFTGDALSDPEGITAYYPSDYDGTWPTVQNYVTGNIPQGVPMKATDISVDGEGNVTHISFKNEGGILRLNLTGTATVTSITVSATNLTNDITLNCDEGVQLDEDNATPFHIAVPGADAGTAYSGLQIEITDKDGYVCIKKANTEIKVQRSMITDISLANINKPLVAYGHAYVVLADIKWATENVGAVKIGLIPKYIKQDATYGYYYNQTNAKTAAESWGGAWKLPTEAQWQTLIDRCNWTWMKVYSGGKAMNGYLVTDRNNGNSIFLPAAGNYGSSVSYFIIKGEVCNYWSAGDTKYLYFGNGIRGMYGGNSNDGMAVRPVLN